VGEETLYIQTIPRYKGDSRFPEYRLKMRLYALITAHLGTRYDVSTICVVIAECADKRFPYSEGLFVLTVFIIPPGNCSTPVLTMPFLSDRYSTILYCILHGQ
jgi:hypothetical protein